MERGVIGAQRISNRFNNLRDGHGFIPDPP